VVNVLDLKAGSGAAAAERGDEPSFRSSGGVSASKASIHKRCVTLWTNHRSAGEVQKSLDLFENA